MKRIRLHTSRRGDIRSMFSKEGSIEIKHRKEAGDIDTERVVNIREEAGDIDTKRFERVYCVNKARFWPGRRDFVWERKE